MFTRSIRFKITLLYAAILAVALTAFSLILYHNVSTNLRNAMDSLLKSKAGGIAQAIDTYWEASKLESAENTEATQRPEALRKRRNANFAKIAQKWAIERSGDPTLVNILVQIFDTDGAIISSSKGTQDLTAISKKNFLSVLQGKDRFDTINFEEPYNRLTFRVYTTPVVEHEKVAYIVQVASPMTAMQIALGNIRFSLLLLFPITILVMSAMGSFLVRATLRPVDSMIDTIRGITAENMKMRLASPGTNDEIQKLAETFNGMLRRLEDSFSSQRKLFENLSHELKTPLTILRGELEITLKKMRSGAEYEEVLRSSLEEINRMSGLVENLLLLARLDLKELIPARKEFELNQLLKACINSLKPLAATKEIALRFEPVNTISVNGDEEELKTLFINILDNAIKYTPAGGKIEVISGATHSRAKVWIKDTGIGISPGDLGHVFDRFYRAERSGKSSGSFGLGLSIVRSIAESHGGSVTVESEVSKGTVFTITLPLLRRPTPGSSGI